jgi:ankyrin repeat protein
MCALHWAASLNLVDITLALIKAGANPTILDLKNETPLMKAIHNGHTNIVVTFLDHFTIELTHLYYDYLLAAVKHSKEDIFLLILNHVRNNSIIKEKNFNLNSIDDSVGSLLHYAVVLNSIQQTSNVLNFFENNVEVNIVNKYGQTPLHVCRNGEIAKVLLDHGACMNIKEITGKMPLFNFIMQNDYDCVYEMLKNGCEIENIDRLGNSLLDALLNRTHPPEKLILLLLEAGVTLTKEQCLKQRENYPKRVLNDPKLVKAIEWRLKNPPSLKEIARNSIRVYLNKINSNKSIINSVNRLEKHLPSTLQDYVLLNLNKSFLFKY